jgi:hypothetical protein
MLEEKEEKLQHNVGGEADPENSGASENKGENIEITPFSDGEEKAAETEELGKTTVLPEEGPEAVQVIDAVKDTPMESEPEDNTAAVTISEGSDAEDPDLEESTNKEPGEKEDPLEEIDESNAEDAEDSDNVERHRIPMPDYHSMSMENLVGELQRLIRNEKVQAIKKHVDGI